MSWQSILLVLLLIPVALLAAPAVSAGDVASDVGAGMVASGIDIFFDATSKALVGNASGGIQNMTGIGWYNPFDNPVVRSTNTSMSVFAITIFIAYVLLAMCYLVLQSRAPEKARAMEFSLNSGKAFNLEKFVTNSVSMIALFVFSVLIIMFLLNLAQAASNMMDTSAMTTLENSSQSGFVKFIYSIVWFILQIILALRTLILTMICAFIIVLIFLWKVPGATKPVEIIGLYLVLIIFMQPAMIGTAAVGIGTIGYLSDTGSIEGGTSSIIITLALLILLIVIALLFIVGPFYFHELFFSLRS